MRKWYWILAVLLAGNFTFAAELEFTTFQLGAGLQERLAALEKGKLIPIRSRDKMLANQESELYQIILQEISDSYQSIGKELVGNILRYHLESSMGKESFAGFTWEKPFEYFSLQVNRSLAPDLFDDQRWIVDDKLDIEINAFTFLTHLQDAGEINIAPEQLAAYAGISFRRSFRYLHFASSYIEGLASDLNKLFLAFTYFGFDQLQKMDANEIICQEDALKYKFGGLVGANWASILNASAGLWAQYQRISKVTVQTAVNLPEFDENQEFLHVSVEKNNGQQFTASGRLQLELYHLLRLTVLFFDLSYQYQEIFKGNFSFSHAEFRNLVNNPEERQELNNLLKLQNVELGILRQYLFQSEQRVSEGRGLSYGVLIAGKKMQSSMEQITVGKAGTFSHFVQLFTTNLSYLENFGSKLLLGIVNRLFDSNLAVGQYVASRLQEVKLDYQQVTEDPFDMLTGLHGSIVFRQELKIGKNYFWNAKRNQRVARTFAANFTTLPDSIKTLIANGKLQGPFAFQTSIRVTGDGIDYFAHLELAHLQMITQQMCQEASDKENCQQELILCHQRFVRKWQQEHFFSGPLLRDLLDQINSKVKNLVQYQQLFSNDQVFINGIFTGTTQEQLNFASSFRQGKFAGQGIIDGQLHHPNFPLVIEY